MPAYLRLFRFPNLLIIAATQYLIQYFLIIPLFKLNSIQPALGGWNFALFTLMTVIVAAGGYLINDVVDYEIDLINKPEKVFINRLISKKNALVLYVFLFGLGLAIAWYTSSSVNNLPLVPIFLSFWGLLWAYSLFFKKMPFIGNLAVAFSCAFVPAELLIAEQAGLELVGKNVRMIVWVYIIFAFLTTLFREIIKDLEDIEGDKAANCRTLPIAIGLEKTKAIAMVTGAAIILCLLFSIKWLFEKQALFTGFFAVFCLLLPSFYVCVKLINAKTKNEFGGISLVIKIIMLAGLFALLFLS